MRLRGLPHDGEPIRCDPTGCCIWVGPGTLAAARRRLYEAGRGALAPSARVECGCGHRRCVNLDHLRVRGMGDQDGVARCGRGHALDRATVVRHRDGRIAYCRLCRNERRRERYRTDATYARREIARQRSLRTRSAR